MFSLYKGRPYFNSSSVVATGSRRSITRTRVSSFSNDSPKRRILLTSFSSSTRATNTTSLKARRAITSAMTEGASTRTSSSPSPFNLLAWYSKQLDKRPLLTKSITGGLIAGGGDLICQSIIDDKADDNHDQSFWDRWDGRRSWNFLLLGFSFVAPTSHYWYAALDKKLVPGNSILSVGKRVLVDQFTWTPVFMVVWLSSLWTLEGTKPDEIPNALSKSLPDVMMANWALWIPAQAINFYFVPVKFQVLFTNVFELLWNAYLSFAAAGKGAKEDNDDPSEKERG